MKKAVSFADAGSRSYSNPLRSATTPRHSASTTARSSRNGAACQRPQCASPPRKPFTASCQRCEEAQRSSPQESPNTYESPKHQTHSLPPPPLFPQYFPDPQGPFQQPQLPHFMPPPHMTPPFFAMPPGPGIPRPHPLSVAQPLHDLGFGPTPFFGWASVMPRAHSYGQPKFWRYTKPDYRRYCFSVGKADVPYASLPGGPLEGMPAHMAPQLVGRF